MWNAITGLLTIIGALLANVLLVIFWLDGKVETNNIKVDNAVIQNTARVDNMVSENSKRFREVYRIIISQEGRITDNIGRIGEIDEFLKTVIDTANKEGESDPNP